jgi:hypothetical protein
VQPWARYCVRCQELEEKGLLPQSAFQVGDEEEAPRSRKTFSPPMRRSSGPEVDDEVLDDDPLVVDADDSEE